LEFDFAVRGGGGARAFEGVAFVDGGHADGVWSGFGLRCWLWWWWGFCIYK
jgi:hypothetical protein